MLSNYLCQINAHLHRPNIKSIFSPILSNFNTVNNVFFIAQYYNFKKSFCGANKLAPQNLRFNEKLKNSKNLLGYGGCESGVQHGIIIF